MAISNYLKTCDYRLGGLKPFIYLIHKNALKLNIKAKGIEVRFNKTKEGDVYKVEGASVIYNQTETNYKKYQFNSTLDVTINELYREPFFYGMKTLRTNQYYIIIEDKKGIQYLVNPELYTSLNYEYSFSDGDDTQNAVTLTYTNLSNFPLLIFTEKVEADKILLAENRQYNIGQAFKLLMSIHNDFKCKDDTVKITEIYIDDINKLKEIDYLKETFTLTEQYDGKQFTVNLSFSIPLDDNQFSWAYNLLEHTNNKYSAILRTSNDNYVIVGLEKGLIPSYTINTSEDDATPNTINIVFTQISQYPLLYTEELTQYRWVDDVEQCFGYEKYQMLAQQYSKDWGNTWVYTEPMLKKKGSIIANNTEECKEYQWVEDGSFCDHIRTEYIKWIDTNDYVCEGGNKYRKKQKHTSEDNVTFTPTDEYAQGEMIEEGSQECSYIAVRWVEDGYECYEVNETLTRWSDISDEEFCENKNLVKKQYEEVTINGNTYYLSGEERNYAVIEDCCDCGYRKTEWRENTSICASDLLTITNTEGDWTIDGDTFTSNQVSLGYGTTMSIDFDVDTSGKLIVNYDVNASSSCGKFEIRYGGSNFIFYSTQVGKKELTVESSGTHNIVLYYSQNCSKNSQYRDNVIVSMDFVVDGLEHSKYAKLSKEQKYLVCNDGRTSVAEPTNEFRYSIVEENSCDCGYYEVVTKTEQEYKQLTRRNVLDNEYIDEEHPDADGTLYDYLCEVTYSGASCGDSDNVIWKEVSYTLIQPYVVEERDAVIELPMLAAVKQRSTDVYVEAFDVRGNRYLLNNQKTFYSVLPQNSIENGIELYATAGFYGYGSIEVEFPHYSISSMVLGDITARYGSNAKLYYDETVESDWVNFTGIQNEKIEFIDANELSLYLTVCTSNCQVGQIMAFETDDTRLFKYLVKEKYEVLDNGSVLIDSHIQFDGYTYREYEVPYNPNDPNTYIVVDNNRYKIIKKQFYTNVEWYDTINGRQGDLIE